MTIGEFVSGILNNKATRLYYNGTIIGVRFCTYDAGSNSLYYADVPINCIRQNSKLYNSIMHSKKVVSDELINYNGILATRDEINTNMTIANTEDMQTVISMYAPKYNNAQLGPLKAVDGKIQNNGQVEYTIENSEGSVEIIPEKVAKLLLKKGVCIENLTLDVNKNIVFTKPVVKRKRKTASEKHIIDVKKACRQWIKDYDNKTYVALNEPIEWFYDLLSAKDMVELMYYAGICCEEVPQTMDTADLRGYTFPYQNSTILSTEKDLLEDAVGEFATSNGQAIAVKEILAKTLHLMSIMSGEFVKTKVNTLELVKGDDVENKKIQRMYRLYIAFMYNFLKYNKVPAYKNIQLKDIQKDMDIIHDILVCRDIKNIDAQAQVHASFGYTQMVYHYQLSTNFKNLGLYDYADSYLGSETIKDTYKKMLIKCFTELIGFFLNNPKAVMPRTLVYAWRHFIMTGGDVDNYLINGGNSRNRKRLQDALKRWVNKLIYTINAIYAIGQLGIYRVEDVVGELTATEKNSIDSYYDVSDGYDKDDTFSSSDRHSMIQIVDDYMNPGDVSLEDLIDSAYITDIEKDRKLWSSYQWFDNILNEDFKTLKMVEFMKQAKEINKAEVKFKKIKEPLKAYLDTNLDDAVAGRAKLSSLRTDFGFSISNPSNYDYRMENWKRDIALLDSIDPNHLDEWVKQFETLDLPKVGDYGVNSEGEYTEIIGSVDKDHIVMLSLTLSAVVNNLSLSYVYPTTYVIGLSDYLNAYKGDISSTLVSFKGGYGNFLGTLQKYEVQLSTTTMQERVDRIAQAIQKPIKYYGQEVYITWARPVTAAITRRRAEERVYDLTDIDTREYEQALKVLGVRAKRVGEIRDIYNFIQKIVYRYEIPAYVIEDTITSESKLDLKNYRATVGSFYEKPAYYSKTEVF